MEKEHVLKHMQALENIKKTANLILVKKSRKEMAEMSKGPRVNEFISFQKSINDYSDVHVNGQSH